MAVSTYERDARLATFRGTAYPTNPANFYMSLHSGDPGLNGASELSGNGYARVAVSVATGSWSAPATNGAVRQITNAIALAFAAATGSDWASATHWGLWDALTTGNFKRGTSLSTAKTVQVGDIASFAIGDLVLNET